VTGKDSGRMTGPALRLLGLPVDLNHSSVEDLQALPGVGPKLAARILSELKDKAGRIALGGFAPAGGGVAAAVAAQAGGGVLEDAVSSLVNLGYRRLEAFEAVGAAAHELGEGADASALIRAALKRMGRELAR